MVAVLLLAGALPLVAGVGGEGVRETEAEGREEEGVEAGVDWLGDVVAEEGDGDDEPKDSGTDQQDLGAGLVSNLFGISVPSPLPISRLSLVLNRCCAFDLAPHVTLGGASIF